MKKQYRKTGAKRSPASRHRIFKPWFVEAANWLWENRKAIKAYDFDYPDYGGMPKLLSKKLSSDFVDAIQDIVYQDPTYLSMLRSKRKFILILLAPGVVSGAVDVSAVMREFES